MSDSGHGKKKVEAAQEGAPLWCIVYADMVTQLMAFFIMLFALSEIRSDKGKILTSSIRVAFHGRRQFGGTMGARTVTSVAQAQAAIAQAIEGPDWKVRDIRGSGMVVIGGKVLFEKGSAELLPQSYAILRRTADVVEGYRNRVEVRGHASHGELSPGARFADEWELSFYRAKAVADFLVRVGKIDEKRLRVTGSSYHDPAAASMFGDEDMRNRRVEIVEVREMVTQ